MRRREFIAATAALLVPPRRSLAQGTRRRLGVLGYERVPTMHKALLDGLRNHGWIDGRNLIIEYRYAQAQDRLPALAAELVALSPDLLIAGNPQTAVALKSATATTSIVFVAVADPGARPRAKPIATRRQHNGSCDIGTGTVHQQNDRNTAGNGSYRFKIAILVNPDNPIHRLTVAEELPQTA